MITCETGVHQYQTEGTCIPSFCYESINQSKFRAVWILFTDTVGALTN